MFTKEQVANIIKPKIIKMGYKLSDIQWLKEDGLEILRVSIDNVDLDACVEITNNINPLLDDLDIGNDDWFLEVCSEGGEKNYEWKDLNNLQNEYLFIELSQPSKDTNSNFINALFVKFENNILTVKLNLKGRMKNIELKKEDVVTIKKDYKF